MRAAVSIAAEAAPRLRDAATLMRASALAALQPCRVSVSRALLVRAIRELWTITRLAFDLE